MYPQMDDFLRNRSWSELKHFFTVHSSTDFDLSLANNCCFNLCFLGLLFDEVMKVSDVQLLWVEVMRCGADHNLLWDYVSCNVNMQQQLWWCLTPAVLRQPQGGGRLADSTSSFLCISMIWFERKDFWCSHGSWVDPLFWRQTSLLRQVWENCGTCCRLQSLLAFVAHHVAITHEVLLKETQVKCLGKGKMLESVWLTKPRTKLFDGVQFFPLTLLLQMFLCVGSSGNWCIWKPYPTVQHAGILHSKVHKLHAMNRLKLFLFCLLWTEWMLVTTGTKYGMSAVALHCLHISFMVSRRNSYCSFVICVSWAKVMLPSNNWCRICWKEKQRTYLP